MPIYTIDESQRKAAKVAGIAYLITFATGVYVNFGIHDRLIVANNAAETAQLSEIRRPGEVAYPYECCGVLTGEMLAGGSKRVLGVARCSNTHNDLSRSWSQIDPRELVLVQREACERGEDVVGFYHSHPDDAARWSGSDLEEAHWTGCSYVIISVEQGVAAQTNSFELAGEQSSKRFELEQL